MKIQSLDQLGALGTLGISRGFRAMHTSRLPTGSWRASGCVPRKRGSVAVLAPLIHGRCRGFGFATIRLEDLLEALGPTQTTFFYFPIHGWQTKGGRT